MHRPFRDREICLPILSAPSQSSVSPDLLLEFFPLLYGRLWAKCSFHFRRNHSQALCLIELFMPHLARQWAFSTKALLTRQGARPSSLDLPFCWQQPWGIVICFSPLYTFFKEHFAWNLPLFFPVSRIFNQHNLLIPHAIAVVRHAHRFIVYPLLIRDKFNWGKGLPQPSLCFPGSYWSGIYVYRTHADKLLRGPIHYWACSIVYRVTSVQSRGFRHICH